MGLPDPRAPFERWPRQLWSLPLESFVWYARPGIFVTQTLQPKVTLRHAEAAAAAMDLVLSRFADEIREQGGLLVLHDWRTVSQYDPEARRFYAQRIEKYERGTLRKSVLATSHSPMVRALLQLVAMALPLRTGVTIQLVDDPGPVLATLHASPVEQNPFVGFMA